MVYTLWGVPPRGSHLQWQYEPWINAWALQYPGIATFNEAQCLPPEDMHAYIYTIS